MIRAVIFDWGRTLWDNDAGALYPDAEPTLEALAGQYRLALCSVALESPEERLNLIRRTGLDRYFECMRAVPRGTPKDGILDETLAELALAPHEVAVVDDRMFRSIAWGNRVGATTFWVRRGRFADELPTRETGQPTYTIGAVADLLPILGA